MHLALAAYTALFVTYICAVVSLGWPQEPDFAERRRLREESLGEISMRFSRMLPEFSQTLEDPFNSAEVKLSSAEEALLRLHGDKLVDEEGGNDLEGGGQPDLLISASCASCRAVIGFLATVIRNGTSYEDVSQLALTVCNALLFNVTGWDPDIVCAGTIDNYAPHVYFILNSTTESALEICDKVNKCPEHEGLRSSYGKDDRDIVQTSGHLSSSASSSLSSSSAKTKSIGALGNGNYASRAEMLNNSIKIVQLTDIHLDDKYAEGSPTECNLAICCHDYWIGEGSANSWGDYECNLPMSSLDLLLDFVAQWGPDFVVYTGDSSASVIWEETLSGQLNSSRQIAEAIARHMPGVLTYPAIGNHDPFPTNIYYTKNPATQAFNEEFGKYWALLANFTAAQIATIQNGGYYSTLVRPGLRILSYNSLYGNTQNYYNILNEFGQDYADMRQFMEDIMQQSRDANEKVILLAHHFFGGGATMLFHSHFLTDILTRNRDIIVLHLLGHSHTDTFGMVTDQMTGEVYDVFMSAPAMTTSPYINPSVRLYYIDPVTFEPLDYDQYHFDLGATIETGSIPEVKFIYRFSDEYGVPDLSSESYRDLTDRFEFDPELFTKWRHNKETRVGDPGECTGSCLTNTLCSLRSSAYDIYLNCTNSLNL